MVYSIKEYDELESMDPLTTYFTRASYDPVTKTLTPAYKDWELYCICRKPLNPNDIYINCDGCGKWYHPQCVGVTNEEAAEVDEFFCTYCKSSKREGEEEENNLEEEKSKMKDEREPREIK